MGHDDIDLERNQFGRERGKPLGLPLRPAIFDRDVPTLDVAGFVQPLMEPGYGGVAPVGQAAADEPDHRHRLLLRAGGEGPRDSSAPEDEKIAPVQSFTLIVGSVGKPYPAARVSTSGSTEAGAVLANAASGSNDAFRSGGIKARQSGMTHFHPTSRLAVSRRMSL